MPEMHDYPHGTPSWVDLTTSEVAGAAAFYGALLGWEAVDQGEAFGHYHQFQLGGQVVAGMMRGAGDMPVVWTTYVSTDDAEVTAAAVREHGGGVIVPPMPVHDLGVMAVFTDPQGAAFGAWQPGTHRGAALVNEPGTLVWNELAVRDPQAVIPFYASVFGWGHETAPMGPTEYTTWKLGERGVAGMLRMTDEWPPEVPAHWMVYFAVDDCDASCAQAQELGGTVSVEPHDIPVGRFAVLGDPQGAPFSVIAMAP
jgi:predicted enzyme related to lactoylglutathione lyase